MTDLTSLGALMTEYMDRGRTRAKLRECPQHRGQPAGNCSACRADRLVQGAEARQDYIRERAMLACDARFPRRYANAMPSNPDVAAWAQRTADDLDNASSLLLLGAVGTGKTYQAYGALRATLVCQPSLDWQAVTFADFAAALRPRAGNDSEAEMTRYCKTGLLLLDDLGAAKSSEWVEEITYRLINGRYEHMRPAVFTTNLALPELKDAIGDRIASRLAETCTRVVLTGPDRRRTRATTQPTTEETP